jgi:hypothetical protein
VWCPGELCPVIPWLLISPRSAGRFQNYRASEGSSPLLAVGQLLPNFAGRKGTAYEDQRSLSITLKGDFDGIFQ